jgi:peroxiredoxin
MIALKRQIIEVPEGAGGREETPLDLGVIDMLAQLRPGDLAPEFDVKTMDGQSVKLSDLKGKYVLLDFWATWSAGSVAEMGELKETCAAFAGDPRFAMIGLNLDADPALARAFVNNNGIGWKQGLLGKWTESAVAERYGVERVPLIIILDTNGRVLQTGLKEGNIKSAVHVALTAHD